jgi:hypothetical protein
MTYSCGIFQLPDSSLFEASVAKFDAACSKLALSGNVQMLLTKPRSRRAPLATVHASTA